MDPRYVGLIGKKILENVCDNGKNHPGSESGICAFVCEREKK